MCHFYWIYLYRQNGTWSHTCFQFLHNIFYFDCVLVSLKKLGAARRSRWRQLLYRGNGSIFNIPSVNDVDFLLSTLLMFVKLWLHILWVPCRMGLRVFKILSYYNFFILLGGCTNWHIVIFVFTHVQSQLIQNVQYEYHLLVTFFYL